MPHQCVHCSKIYPIASKELIEGCSECGGHFFFYIKEEQLEKLKEKSIEIPEKEKSKVEKDIREIAGIQDENTPVILDVESVRSEEHTSELQSHSFISYAVFCLKKKKQTISIRYNSDTITNETQ